MHVLSAQRWQLVVDELRDLLEGRYGDAARARSTRRSQRAVDAPRRRAPSARTDEPHELDDLREDAEGLAASEEELLLLALFGAEAEPLLRAIRGARAPRRRARAPGSAASESERLRELIRVVQESGIGELTIEEGEWRVTVRQAEARRRRRAGRAVPHAGLAPEDAALADAPLAPPADDVIRGRVADGRDVLPRARRRARRRSSRWATRSRPGQTLCILEAMKLMNEIKAEREGVVRRICVENAQPVEYGQTPLRARAPERPPARRALAMGRARAVCSSPRAAGMAGRCAAHRGSSSRYPAHEELRTGVRGPCRHRHGIVHESRARRVRRVLIANRGEVAVRVIRACRELGIETVAVYSTADRDSLHVRARRPRRPHRAAAAGAELPADPVARRRRRRRPAATPCTRAGASSPRTRSSRAACEDNDLVFVGPTPEAIETMGDKVRAKETVAAAGLPLVPGLGRAGHARRGAGRSRREIGFPLLLKAAAGGGGKGMRLVATAEELEPAYRMAVGRGARRAFGDGVALRRAGGRRRAPRRDPGARRRRGRRPHARRARLLDPAAPPEADRGGAVARRHARAPRARWRTQPARACEALRYRGAGTIEFLARRASGSFYFIEMNTRLQVEHPVTELLTGIDLVHGQLRVAAGEGLPRDGPRRAPRPRDRVPHQRRGSARDFLPAPGHRHALPPAARARRPRRHPRLRGLPDPAVLRLARSRR